MAVKPSRIKKGSTIGIIAPSSPCYNDDIMASGVRVLEEMGFKVVLGKTVSKKYGYLAGDDWSRAEDINNFFERDDIDAIMCLRGGYGALRILDKIDYRKIRKNPKVFIGYSDITALHLAINKMCSMVTFHGPMVSSDFGNKVDEYTMESFLRAVCEPRPLGKLKNPGNAEAIKVLMPGKAQGDIICGNLTVMVSTLGTPYEINTRDKILFIEDCGEEPYRIDRMLTQLMLCRKLQTCKAIVLGQWTDCTPKEPEKSLSLVEVFKDRLLSLGIPILYNLAFGHGVEKMTIPIGVKAMITEEGKIIVCESGVRD